MPFCQECGYCLSDGSKFCGKCGTPVTAGTNETPVRSPVPASPGTGTAVCSGVEKVIAIIPNLMTVRGLGIFLKGPVWHHMVVTPQRIILVRRTVQGLDRFKQDIGIIGPDYEFPLMKAMQPEKILEEYPESLVIPQKDLVSMTVTKYVTHDQEEGPQYFWQVRLDTKEQVITLRTDYNEDPGGHFRDPALIQVLRERLVLEDR